MNDLYTQQQLARENNPAYLQRTNALYMRNIYIGTAISIASGILFAMALKKLI